MPPAIIREQGQKVRVEWVLFKTHNYSEARAQGMEQSFPEDSRRIDVDLDQLENSAPAREAFRRQLRNLRIEGLLIGGMDMGTRAAAYLNALGGREDNPPATRFLRSDKSLQADAFVKNKNLKSLVIPTLALTDLNSALRFIYDNPDFASDALVLKFSAGSGGEGLKILPIADRGLIESTLRDFLDRKLSNNFDHEDFMLLQPELRVREFSKALV